MSQRCLFITHRHPGHNQWLPIVDTVLDTSHKLSQLTQQSYEVGIIFYFKDK